MNERLRTAIRLLRGLSVALFLTFCLAIGDSTHAAPPGTMNVTVHSGDDLMRLVAQSPPRTTFHIQAGVYRLQTITPKEGDVFVGEPGAILDGAQLVAGFVSTDQIWAAPLRVSLQGDYRGECFPSHPACKLPEDLFIDNTPLMRVESMSEVSSGKWYLDYSGQKVYLGDDPTGHSVEVSIKPYAIRGDAPGVRIENLTIEKYASAAGDGAVDGRSLSGHLSQGWVVQNNVVTLNHGMGIRLGDGMQVLGNKIIENGQLGLGGGGSDGLVDGNEVARNNYAGYDYSWEAGGSKFAFSRNLIVRNNFVHDNDGPGLWTDLENENTLYEHNHTQSNREAGILHEVSYRAIIRENLIENDGFSDYQGKTAPWYGAGIIIAGSADVEVYSNTVKNCMNGIVGTQPRRGLSRQGTPYLLQNLNVHDNVITQGQGTAAGILSAEMMGSDVFASRNNRFTNNQFHLADPQAKFFAWKGEQLAYGDWVSEMRR